jgi:lysophospholipase L1-like esterase
MKKSIIAIGIVVGIIVIGLLINATHPSLSTSNGSSKTYIALGDSVAAGVGLDTASDYSACDRTNESYPFQLSSLLSYKLTNAACSGATIPMGITGQQTVNKLSLPSQINQLFSVKSVPNLISLTIGANDTGWIQIITDCYTGKCGTVEQTDAIGQRLAILDTNLSNTLDAIKSHYGVNPPRMIVTDYYQVFPQDTGSCSDLHGIDANARLWIRQVESSVNNRLRAIVANYNFVKFVHIDFSGHELCTRDSWIQGAQDTAPFHPTKMGQASIARQLYSAITSLR